MTTITMRPEDAEPLNMGPMTPMKRCAWLLAGALKTITRGGVPDLVTTSHELGPLPDMNGLRDGHIVLHASHYYMRCNGGLYRQSVDDALTKEWEEVEVPKPEEEERKV